MWKKFLIGAGLALGVAACASTPSTPDASKAAAAANLAPPGCVGDTATRLPLSAHECAAFGHQWTHEDVKQTGATDMGSALRLLDPTAIVHE
jgi:hypothetical protein